MLASSRRLRGHGGGDAASPAAPTPPPRDARAGFPAAPRRRRRRPPRPPPRRRRRRRRPPRPPRRRPGDRGGSSAAPPASAAAPRFPPRSRGVSGVANPTPAAAPAAPIARVARPPPHQRRKRYAPTSYPRVDSFIPRRLFQTNSIRARASSSTDPSSPPLLRARAQVRFDEYAKIDFGGHDRVETHGGVHMLCVEHPDGGKSVTLTQNDLLPAGYGSLEWHWACVMDGSDEWYFPHPARCSTGGTNDAGDGKASRTPFGATARSSCSFPRRRRRRRAARGYRRQERARGSTPTSGTSRFR